MGCLEPLHRVSGTLPSALYLLAFQILINPKRKDYYSYFIIEEAEAQRDELICFISHASKWQGKDFSGPPTPVD